MGYYRQFPAAIPHLGVRSMLLLTLPPLALAGPSDLHALAIPPAFNLSQDQTLQLNFIDAFTIAGSGNASIKVFACQPVGSSHGPVR